MLLLLKDDHHVAGDDSGCLVSFTVEGDLLAVLHALVNMDLEDLALALSLLSLALLAAILLLDDFSLAVALRAHSLHLLHHTGSNLSQADGDSVSVARITGL